MNDNSDIGRLRNAQMRIRGIDLPTYEFILILISKYLLNYHARWIPSMSLVARGQIVRRCDRSRPRGVSRRGVEADIWPRSCRHRVGVCIRPPAAASPVSPAAARAGP